jgi:hypothetical protein
MPWSQSCKGSRGTGGRATDLEGVEGFGRRAVAHAVEVCADPGVEDYTHVKLAALDEFLAVDQTVRVDICGNVCVSTSWRRAPSRSS